MPKAKRNKFSGVDDVYLTKKSIVQTNFLLGMIKMVNLI